MDQVQVILNWLLSFLASLDVHGLKYSPFQRSQAQPEPVWAEIRLPASRSNKQGAALRVDFTTSFF